MTDPTAHQRVPQLQTVSSDNNSPCSISTLQEDGVCSEKHATQDGIHIVDWDGPNDPANPRNWSNVRKWFITSCAILGTFLITMNGTSITVAVDQLNSRFNVSDASFPNSYWAVTSWSIGGAVFIIVGLPLVEELGVRLVYQVAYVFFLLMIFPQAFAQNYATLVVTRFLSGGCVGLLANTVASVIPDVFDDDRARSLPISIWILSYLVGPTLGAPIFSGVIQHIGDWRWIFYIQLIIYGALLPFFFITIKETRGCVILSRRAAALRKETGKDIYYTQEDVNESGRSKFRNLSAAMYRPLYLQFTEPVLVACTIWSGFSFGTVYLFTQATGQVFSKLYGWETWYTGYVQVAIAVGEIVGWIASLYGTHLYFESTKRNNETPGLPIPEARLYVSIFGSMFGIAGGMFLFAWTSYPDIPWIAPAIGLAMVGFGIQTVVSAVADYIVDCYAASNYAASAVSGCAAGENIVAGFLPLATQSLYRNLGFQWASSLIGFLALGLSLAPVLFVWKGRIFRERSPFMLSSGQTGMPVVRRSTSRG